YFFIAMATFFFIKASPLDVIGKYYLFSAHTLQMSLAYFLALPLLILSIPTGILRQYVWHHQTKFIVKMLSHPWMSLITFNGFFSFFFLLSLFKVLKFSLFATFIVQVIFLFSS